MHPIVTRFPLHSRLAKRGDTNWEVLDYVLWCRCSGVPSLWLFKLVQDHYVEWINSSSMQAVPQKLSDLRFPRHGKGRSSSLSQIHQFLAHVYRL